MQKLFEIRKNNVPIDGISYPSLTQACKAMLDAKIDGEVVWIDALGSPVHSFTAEERRIALFNEAESIWAIR